MIHAQNWLRQVTPLVLTYNEAPNIERTLQKLTWADRIVIIDSFSKDETLEIAKQYPQADIFQREFDTFANQCNYGLSKVRTDWVLSLDADYVLSNELIREIKCLSQEDDINGYQVELKYCIFGKPLRGTLLPSRKVLYKRSKAVYQDDGHAHRVLISGETATLRSPIFHDDRKSLSRWLWAQDRYMVIEAEKLAKTPISELSFSDKVRQTKILAPFVILVYCLVLKGGLLDGWRGWYYAFQRAFAEILLAIRLIEVQQTSTLDS